MKGELSKFLDDFWASLPHIKVVDGEYISCPGTLTPEQINARLEAASYMNAAMQCAATMAYFNCPVCGEDHEEVPYACETGDGI